MLECFGDFQTVHRLTYKPPSALPKGFNVRATKPAQQDETILSGYYQRNLQVEGEPKSATTRTWPKSYYGLEEYKDFLKRLECCKKELYKLYFHCPDVNLKLLDKMIKELDSSVYRIDYSPEVYVALNEIRRLYITFPGPANMKYYETTYRTYFNRIEELLRFKEALYGEQRHRKEAENLKNDLKKIYRCGRQSYYDEICLPAIQVAKTKKLHDGPIDKYTLRRV